MTSVIDCVKRANLLLEQGKYTEARAVLHNCPEYGSATDAAIPLYFSEINIMLAEGDHSNAIGLLKKIDRPDGRVLVKLYCLAYLAEIQQSCGVLDDALKTIENAKRIANQAADTNDDVIYKIVSRYGYILCALERWDEALSTLNQANKICPDGDQEPSIALHIAYCLQALHRNTDALQKINGVLNQAENTGANLVAEAYFRKGAILLEMGQYNNAYRAFLNAENSGGGELEVAIQKGKKRAANGMLRK